MNQATQEKIIHQLVELHADPGADPHQWSGEVFRHLRAFNNRLHYAAIQDEQARVGEILDAIDVAAPARNWKMVHEIALYFVKQAIALAQEIGVDVVAFLAVDGQKHAEQLAPGRCGVEEVEQFVVFLSRYQDVLQKRTDELEAEREASQELHRLVVKPLEGRTADYVPEAQRVVNFVGARISGTGIREERQLVDALKLLLERAGMVLAPAEGA
jgi:hypothetical protein